eukprot:TRINITY_DN8996_c0_g1_i1.p1 TRINITY_DN8996_c0_g1~~TRINITY_DN8996_c0_g1_i1.p1  ORF type:complete len:567 (+),score=126.56 TRINITY_DN8996_c0_g1_i1:17-1717(+)
MPLPYDAMWSMPSLELEDDIDYACSSEASAEHNMHEPHVLDSKICISETWAEEHAHEQHSLDSERTWIIRHMVPLREQLCKQAAAAQENRCVGSPPALQKPRRARSQSGCSLTAADEGINGECRVLNLITAVKLRGQRARSASPCKQAVRPLGVLQHGAGARRTSLGLVRPLVEAFQEERERPIREAREAEQRQQEAEQKQQAAELKQQEEELKRQEKRQEAARKETENQKREKRETAQRVLQVRKDKLMGRSNLLENLVRQPVSQESLRQSQASLPKQSAEDLKTSMASDLPGNSAEVANFQMAGDDPVSEKPTRVQRRPSDRSDTLAACRLDGPKQCNAKVTTADNNETIQAIQKQRRRQSGETAAGAAFRKARPRNNECLLRPVLQSRQVPSQELVLQEQPLSCPKPPQQAWQAGMKAEDFSEPSQLKPLDEELQDDSSDSQERRDEGHQELWIMQEAPSIRARIVSQAQKSPRKKATPTPSAMSYLLKDLPNAGCQVEVGVIPARSPATGDLQLSMVRCCTWCRTSLPVMKVPSSNGYIRCPNCKRSFDASQTRPLLLGGSL